MSVLENLEIDLVLQKKAPIPSRDKISKSPLMVPLRVQIGYKQWFDKAILISMVVLLLFDCSVKG